MYTTPEEIRDLLGLELGDAEDAILNSFITKAQNVILHHIQVPIKNETMTGNINGSNNTFTVSHAYLADINFDKEITISDFTIYGWTDADDPSTKAELDVSTFYPEQGMIVLSTAPSTDYDRISINYSYYTCAIDWNLVDLATAYYAGMLFVAREQFLVPEDLAIGNLRIRTREPWEKLRREFQRMVFHITSIPMDKTTYRKMVFDPRKREQLYGPGTSYEKTEGNIGDNIKDTT